MLFMNDERRIAGNESEDVAYLTTADGCRTDLICGMLWENDIPFMCKERSRGAFTDVVLGFAVMGKDIYVARSRLSDAQALLDGYFSDSCEEKPEE